MKTASALDAATITRALRPSGWLNRNEDFVARLWAALATRGSAEAGAWLEQLVQHATRKGSISVALPRERTISDGEGSFRRELDIANITFAEIREQSMKDDDPLWWRAIIQVAIGSTLIHLGRYEEARAVLHEARGVAACIPSRPLLHAALLLEADVADHLGGSDFLETLEAALRAGRESGASDVPLVSRSRIAVLCARALEHGIEIEYVQSIIRRVKLAAPPSAGASWPYSLHIRALGGFEILVGGRPLVPKGKAQVVPLRMLETLVALGGRGVEKWRLTDVLWPDAAGDTGGQAFNTTLHRLRRLLGDPRVLVLFDAKLSLTSELVWTDVWAVERLLEGFDQRLRGNVGDPIATQRLIDLYRGPLNADSEQSVWVAPRARLHERIVQTILRSAETIEEQGDVAGARVLFTGATGVDPTVEAFYRGEMRCAARLGERAEVARIFKRCRRVLQSTLGMDPSPATQELYLRESARQGSRAEPDIE